MSPSVWAESQRERHEMRLSNFKLNYLYYCSFLKTLSKTDLRYTLHYCLWPTWLTSVTTCDVRQVFLKPVMLNSMKVWTGAESKRVTWLRFEESSITTPAIIREHFNSWNKRCQSWKKKALLKQSHKGDKENLYTSLSCGGSHVLILNGARFTVRKHHI